jgi:hypothetical protein
MKGKVLVMAYMLQNLKYYLLDQSFKLSIDNLVVKYSVNNTMLEG